jgi:hypothetical protein
MKKKRKRWMGRTATGDKSDCCDRAASGQSITNIDVVVIIIIIIIIESIQGH